MNTVFNKKTVLSFFLCLLLGTGCAFFPFKEEKSLAVLQKLVRQRMLKLQSTELLTAAAQERYNPVKATEVAAFGAGYQGHLWHVDTDPALQVLENAISFALLVRSSSPEKTAEKVTAAMLDYGTAVRFLKLKTRKNSAASSDFAAELAMMTGMSVQKIKEFASAPLPQISTELFSLSPEAERMLNEKGNAAAFTAAAELYRNPSEAEIAKAERLRRAMLNRVLLQGETPGAKITPELYIAHWRSKVFSGVLPSF